MDVLRLVPNKFITQNEIDAANQVHFDELNVQNQPKITCRRISFVAPRLYRPADSRQRARAPADCSPECCHRQGRSIAI